MLICLLFLQSKLNEAVVFMNKSLQVCAASRDGVYIRPLTTPQEINVQNMNVELVAQMFKNYQSNVLFHLERKCGNQIDDGCYGWVLMMV